MDTYNLYTVIKDMVGDIEVWHEDDFGRKYPLYDLEIDIENHRIILK